ncbi:hypothetical protein, partial [Enterococcus faecalis]|uniref:hypothetical protein n=1 Tax=Enterococcus faecalis TaxID=1351 RepID=UPI003D6B639B
LGSQKDVATLRLLYLLSYIGAEDIAYVNMFIYDLEAKYTIANEVINLLIINKRQSGLRNTRGKANSLED